MSGVEAQNYASLDDTAGAALATLRAAVDPATILTDTDTLVLCSQDVFTLGPTPLAVFRPRDIGELSAGVTAAAAAALTIVPRGGGMSYTSGYLAPAAGALVVDLAAMARVLAIDEVDMTVIVEAGCTWATLYAALAPHGLRTPRWGTLSGVRASIGGGMSQNGVFWGARNGSIAESALSFDVVLADGRITRTGNSTLRSFGPDLTGLFAADGGAFGIKAHVTLPLERWPTAVAYGSFAFDAPAGFAVAMSEIARAGLASECFGFDPFLQAQRMKRDSLAADARSLLGTIQAQGGFWRGLKAGAKIVAAGRSFLDEASFSIHCIAEGRSQAGADADMAAIRTIALAAGGREVADTIPRVLRASPFPPVNSMLGPAGERWVPVHGIVRHSRALPVIEAVIALYEANAGAMERLGIGAGYMFLTVGGTGFLIEPVFFWPDAHEALHRASVEPVHLARLHDHPANPAARALVETLRAGVLAIFARNDAVHFQIGRTYALQPAIDPTAWNILGAVKQAVDPQARMNTGVLGL